MLISSMWAVEYDTTILDGWAFHTYTAISTQTRRPMRHEHTINYTHIKLVGSTHRARPYVRKLGGVARGEFSNLLMYRYASTPYRLCDVGKSF